MLRLITMLVIVYGLLSTGAQQRAAGEESDLPTVEAFSERPGVFLVSAGQRKECPRPGRACLLSDGGGTVIGIDVNPTVGIVTTIGRGTQVAGLGALMSALEPEQWRVEMVARLSARTTYDPIIVAVMDYADPEGMARKEAVAVWEVAKGSPVKDLGMHFVFSADDGFQAKHTYLLRVVQGTGENEHILAEGNFELK